MVAVLALKREVAGGDINSKSTMYYRITTYWLDSVARAVNSRIWNAPANTALGQMP